MKKLLALLVLFSTNTWSKSFSNQYTEFELPPNWECVLEGSEYVCQSTNSDRRKEAIIILAAKIRGAQDTLDKYQAYLKRSKTYQLPGGKTQVSEPKSVKVNKVNNHQWVDALHLASEVPGFYTRYLATVKEDLGVAITFSVVNTKYASYKGIFDNIVKSIKVFRQKKQGLSNIRLAKNGANQGIEDTQFIPDQKLDLNPTAGARKKRTDSGGDNSLILILVGAAAVFFILKKKKKS
jgi:hypothetical protein